MNSLPKFMFASARHHKHVSFHINAVFGTHDSSLVGLPFTTGFTKGDGVAMLWSGADGVKQGQDGWLWKAPKNSRNRKVVRSHAAMTTEAPVLTNAETGGSVQKVVIVGAGIAGLSAAVALQRSVIILSKATKLELSLEANPHSMNKTKCSRLRPAGLNLAGRFCRRGRRVGSGNFHRFILETVLNVSVGLNKLPFPGAVRVKSHDPHRL